MSEWLSDKGVYSAHLCILADSAKWIFSSAYLFSSSPSLLFPVISLVLSIVPLRRSTLTDIHSGKGEGDEKSWLAIEWKSERVGE